MFTLPSIRRPDFAALRLLLRRLAAMFYDALLLSALLFIASLPLTLLSGGAIHSGTVSYQFYLLTIIFIYLGWHWTHGGQTLGMKSWRLRVMNPDGTTLNWQQALLRFLGAVVSTAVLGLGHLWLLIDAERLTWHDRWSGTRLVLVNRER